MAAPQNLMLSFRNTAEKIVRLVKKTAKRGDPDDVLRVIDEYSWKVGNVMNVGDVKGEILDKIFKEADPTIAIELGSFLGYSAVRMARLLKPGGKFFAIEVDLTCAKLVEECVEHAGLSDKVTVINGSTESVIPRLKSDHGLDRIDFVFFDHFEHFYIPDLKSLLDTKLFVPGTVVVADNIIYPGHPEYAKFVRNHPNFKSEYFESMWEYSKEKIDAMEKSTYLG